MTVAGSCNASAEADGLFSPVDITVADRESLLACVTRCLLDGNGFAVATLNVDHLVKLRAHAGFRAAYRQHRFVVADGQPVVWLARLAGRPVSLVTGSDLVVPLCGLAAQLDAPIALVGTTPGSLAGAAAVLVGLHPRLRIVCQTSPAYGFALDGPEFDRCIEAIRSSGAALVLLALGAPKQEEFAARALRLLPTTGFVSVGAGLDFLSGTQQRAPALFRAMGMEWLWRLLQDPRRMTQRYLSCFGILPGLASKALRLRLGRCDRS